MLVEWLQFFAGLAERPSRVLWGLAAAAAAALIVAGAIAYFAPSASADITPLIPKSAVIGAALIALAGVATYYERSVKTLAFVPDIAQGFWGRARQPDGREMTQISLRGQATNISTTPVYLADVKLIRPHKRPTSKLLLTQEQSATSTGADNDIPAGGRAAFSVHFFVEGFIGEPGETKTVVISISDHLGHWHKVRFTNLRGLPNE